MIRNHSTSTDIDNSLTRKTFYPVYHFYSKMLFKIIFFIFFNFCFAHSKQESDSQTVKKIISHNNNQIRFPEEQKLVDIMRNI